MYWYIHHKWEQALTTTWFRDKMSCQRAYNSNANVIEVDLPTSVRFIYQFVVEFARSLSRIDMMAGWNCSSGHATGCAAMMFLTLGMAMCRVQALYGHLDIVNAFRSPTQFTCHDDKRSRQTYTASTGEIYNFAFNTELHQYWDCQVSNSARRLSKTLRFWGDSSHGGPALWGCYNCFWSVQEVGVYFYHDGVWRYWYHWY